MSSSAGSGIELEAYSPLTRGRRLDDPVELDPADMDALDALDEGVHYARDPTATP